MTKYFDIRKDKEIIEKGGFWCYACLVGKPAYDMSPDPRYCQGCYEFLLKVAALDNGRRGGDWKPIQHNSKTNQEAEEGGIKAAQVSLDMRTILSTVNGEKSKVDKIRPQANKTTRGRRRQELPEKVIIGLAAKGMGSKTIAAKLLTKYGIKANYRTIARILSGQRILV